MAEFVDRERELAELRQVVEVPGPRLIIVYGRRRIGKTFFLQHAWPERRGFYFLAAATKGALNRAEQLRDLEDLAASGQGWAREGLDPSMSAGHLYVSAAGFSDDMLALAASDGRVRLEGLEGMYGA